MHFPRFTDHQIACMLVVVLDLRDIKMRAVQQIKAFLVKSFGDGHGNIRAILQHRLDPEEMIKMLMRLEQQVNLIFLQHLIYAFAPEALPHPIGIPACIQQDFLFGAIQEFHINEGTVSPCVIPIESLFDPFVGPGNNILVDKQSPGLHHIPDGNGIIEPTGFGDYRTLDTLTGPDIHISYRLLRKKHVFHDRRSNTSNRKIPRSAAECQSFQKFSA